MREIKFRAWIHRDCGGNVPQEIYETMDYSDNYSLEEFFQLYENYFEIMQYTGLKDKKGKEIYEGDICKRDESFFKVEFKSAQWNFISFGRFVSYPYFHSNADQMKIIGNIHENTELL